MFYINVLGAGFGPYLFFFNSPNRVHAESDNQILRGACIPIKNLLSTVRYSAYRRSLRGIKVSANNKSNVSNLLDKCVRPGILKLVWVFLLWPYHIVTITQCPFHLCLLHQVMHEYIYLS